MKAFLWVSFPFFPGLPSGFSELLGILYIKNGNYTAPQSHNSYPLQHLKNPHNQSSTGTAASDERARVQQC